MKSKEEIVASKLYDLLSDSRLEHYLVGRYIAQSFTTEIYDRFQDVVRSARQEKEDRIEWLKQTILGDKTMTTTFDNVCAILTDFEEAYSQDSRFEEFIAVRNLGFPLAIAYVNGMVTGITEEGEKWVLRSFTELLDQLGLHDTGWTDLYEIEQAAEIEPDSSE